MFQQAAPVEDLQRRRTRELNMKVNLALAGEKGGLTRRFQLSLSLVGWRGDLMVVNIVELGSPAVRDCSAESICSSLIGYAVSLMFIEPCSIFI